MHHILVVGGGAGGLELATRLGNTLGRRKKAKITLLDENLTHVWKPLLHEIAAGSLDPTNDELNYVAQAKWNNFNFQLGRMTGLDRAQRTIEVESVLMEGPTRAVTSRKLEYDTLVIAVGSVTNDFNTSGAQEHCIFLDSRDQAERLHKLLLSKYLRAHAEGSGADAIINVAIVGAGATGVELAAELRNSAQQLASYGLSSIQPDSLKITLVEAGDRILAALPQSISHQAHMALEKLGVTILTGSPVREVRSDQLHLGNGTVIDADIKVWAAGIRAPSFLKKLDGLETNRIDQLVVNPNLSVTRDQHIFAFGDCAQCPQIGTDRPVPPRAQAAHQQGATLAKSLANRINGKPLLDYKYKDYGSLVSLSRFTAVGVLMGNLAGSMRVSGWLARMFYISLYRMHQMSLYGLVGTFRLMVGGRFARSTVPRLKLH